MCLGVWLHWVYACVPPSAVVAWVFIYGMLLVAGVIF